MQKYRKLYSYTYILYDIYIYIYLYYNTYYKHYKVFPLIILYRIFFNSYFICITFISSGLFTLDTCRLFVEESCFSKMAEKLRREVEICAGKTVVRESNKNGWETDRKLYK